MEKKTRVLTYKRLHQRREFRQGLGVLMVVSIILAAVLLNDQILKEPRPDWVVSDNQRGPGGPTQSRGVANLAVATPQEQIQWEQNLATSLAVPQEQRTPASFGRSASPLDQIRFGLLAGKYRLEQTTDSKLKAIEYIGSSEFSDQTDQPEYLDREAFLSKYRTNLALPYDNFIYAGTKGLTHSYVLKTNKKEVGRAEFTLDNGGRLLNLKLATSPDIAAP